MKNISFFFAYQFASQTIPRTEREMRVARVVQVINHELRASGSNCSVDWSVCDLQSAKMIYDQIADSVENCSIFIADISEINPNVMFELGMATAFARSLSKQIAILCHDSVDVQNLPSDIRGLFVETYSANHFQQVLAGQLSRCVELHLQQDREQADSHVGDPEIFQLDGARTLDVVCSELPESYLPHFANPDDHNYLRYARFADLDSFIHIKSHVNRLFPALRLRDFTASEHKSADYDALFVLGGPAWNHRFRIFQDQLPFTFIERADDEDDLLQIRPEYGVSAKPFGPQFGIGGRIAKDVSVLCRLTDVTGRRVFLFAGCLTFGVVGACKALLCRGIGLPNARYLHDKVEHDDFVVIFLSDYLEHEVIAPLFESTSVLALFRRRVRSTVPFSLVSHSLGTGSPA